MRRKPTRPVHTGVDRTTVIETGWLCARYAHGMCLPAWLHQLLAHGRLRGEDDRLSVIILPAGEQQESLAVMTLREFLRWQHHCLLFHDRAGKGGDCSGHRRSA